MTTYKIITLFNIHKEFNPDRFKQTSQQTEATLHDEDGFDDIDVALGGL